MKPFLSICIPTYNRAQIVYDTVMNVLKSDREDIEVVVSNNCSTDQTEELLLQIKDERFHYYKNDYNNGADNLISVLTYAQGEFLLLDSDEDDIVIKNLDIYISQLKKYRPAVMVGTSAVNRWRYQYRGNINETDSYEALKKFGFGKTYLSGYIYNRQILKKVLGDTYGTDINRKFGYGFNFMNVARRMLEYGGFMTQDELITNQRVVGRRDMGTHFDGGICSYSPEYRLGCFKDVVRDMCFLSLSEKQKYCLVTDYLNDFVLMECIGDYIKTATGRAEYDMKREREYGISDYYHQNKDANKGLRFYKRLQNILKLAEKEIDDAHIFSDKYGYVKMKYSDETWRAYKKKYEKICRVILMKCMLECKK